MEKNDLTHVFPFVNDQMVKFPELFLRYSSLSEYDLKKDWQEFKAGCSSFDVWRILRVFRQSRLALIGRLDMELSIDQHGLALSLVSQLADLMINEAYQFVLRDMQEKFGKLYTQQHQPMDLCVYSLGKLGAYELNYSSDVDLVFVFDEDGYSDGDRQLSAHQWCERFGRRLIQLLDSVTVDGFVYRVDMRLRPFGSAGALVISKEAFFHYLHNEGREWERLAWMRARLICGKHMKQTVFLNEMNAFIYRRHLDYHILSALSDIRQDMSQQAQKSPGNIKYGEGGIREIEFIVQSMQLVFGGRQPVLQGHLFSKQLIILYDHKLLSHQDYEMISNAWFFHRKLENLCQLRNDLSTHVIPEDSQFIRVLSKIMGCPESLVGQYQRHCNNVAGLFNDFFKPFQKEYEKNSSPEIKRFVDNATLKRASQSVKEIVHSLSKKVINLTNDSVVLDNCAALLKGINGRPSYLMMLDKEPLLLERLLDLLSSHDYFGQVLNRHPLLLELLFEHYSIDRKFVYDQLSEIWEKTPWQSLDEEAWLENIRVFQQSIQFLLMKHYCEKNMSVAEVAEKTTDLAVFIINKVINKCWNEVNAKLPDSQVHKNTLVVIGYGSIANKKMHLKSDVDLVFLYDILQPDSVQMAFLHRWVRRVIHYLSVNTYHGDLYQVDMQLRPNGHSGALLSGLKEFERYQYNQAWVWEHLALVKSMVLYGQVDQVDWFESFRLTVLNKKRNEEDVRSDLKKIVERMGASVKTHQYEFDLLIFILLHTYDFPYLSKPRYWKDLIDCIEKNNLVDVNLVQKWFGYYNNLLQSNWQ